MSVRDEVDPKVEVELGDNNELEIELTWYGGPAGLGARRVVEAGRLGA